MSIQSAVASAVEAVSNWLDPDKKEKRVLREAIEAAEQLLLILRRKGRYKDWDSRKLDMYEIHFQKRFDAWKDGHT